MISHADARTFWTCLLTHWVSALRYVHSQRTHSQILDSLNDPAVRDVYLMLGFELSWFDFLDKVYLMAREAESNGLVKPDGQPRPSARGRAGRPSVQRRDLTSFSQLGLIAGLSRNCRSSVEIQSHGR